MNYEQTNQPRGRKRKTKHYTTLRVCNFQVLFTHADCHLSVAEGLPRSVNRHAITCSCLCESPAISTDL